MSSKPNESYYEVYKELKMNGVCKICAYRFLCNAEFASMNREYLISQGYEEEPPTEKLKLKKSNFCVICLGLFEDKTIEEAKKQVLYEVTQSGYDCKTYMLALILPTSCKLREHSTFLFLKSKFPELYKECPYSPRLGLKEAWRYNTCPSISKLINKQLDAKSEMSVQIEFTHSEDWKDCRILTAAVREQAKGKPGVSCCMKLLGDAEFVQVFPFPMTVPTGCVEIKSVTIKRDSIFFAGRYNKYSRELSQTPWILADGERKMDLSVEEIISDKLKELMQASDSRFSSSGREDVDVRTLGNGRPFAVELVHPRVSRILDTDIRKVEKEINKIGPKLVFVRDLQIVSKVEMSNLKKGEEHKTKDYCCVCVVKKKHSVDYLRSKMPPMPLVIQQKTPIRVLHRRTAAVRPKTIHELTIDPVDCEPPEGCTVFKLNLMTEAGTYIKEFVHGDFGRTQPNMSVLLNNVPVDVVALDVTNVAVNWPPAIDYGSTTK